MARPVTHAARWLAARIEANRLEPRVRRMLTRLQRELHAHPWDTLRGLIAARIARRELLAQQREAHLLANPDADGGKWLPALWAAQRRDVELLALLERMHDDADQPPSLADYLASRASEPPARSAPPHPVVPPPAVVDATAPPPRAATPLATPRPAPEPVDPDNAAALSGRRARTDAEARPSRERGRTARPTPPTHTDTAPARADATAAPAGAHSNAGSPVPAACPSPGADTPGVGAAGGQKRREGGGE